jgi:arabinogalactan oligomer / maltooligosaccharide transport system permease protein
MTTIEQTAASVPVARTEVKAARPKRPHFRDTWWRHLVAIVFAVFALFPPLYVLSAAFNRDPSLTGAALIPAHFTWSNFKNLFSPGNSTTNITSNASNFVHWYANTLIVASATAILTVMLGALAAYAFSRFRFKGRRTGMVFLLLVQMFPQILRSSRST